MDTLLGYVPEVLAAASALWGWRQRVKKNRALAAQAAADAARAALAKRLEDVGDIGQRFAEALLRHDYAALHVIEAERKARGL